MGVWAEIKHALNSSLGTDDFEPLDKMIKSGKGLVQSQNVYYNVQKNLQVSDNLIHFFTNKITFKCAGSVNVKLDFDIQTANASGEFKIYKNGSQFSQIDLEYRTTESPIFSDVSISENDYLTFSLQVLTDKGVITANRLDLCADVTDLSCIRVGNA